MDVFAAKAEELNDTVSSLENDILLALKFKKVSLKSLLYSKLFIILLDLFVIVK